MCDGFVIDMKMWNNLQVESWNDVHLFLGNAGQQGRIASEYQADANVYGRYTDRYLLNLKEENPYEMDLTGRGKVIQPGDLKPPRVHFKLNFTRYGRYMGYVKVDMGGKRKALDKKDEEKDKKTAPPRNVFGGAPGQSGVDAGYIILCCFIVFTMQTGFALLESGFCSPRSQVFYFLLLLVS